MTVRDIEAKYKVSKSSVDRKINILSLPETVLNIFVPTLGQNTFTENHAYEISKLCKPDELKKLFEDNLECFDDQQSKRLYTRRRRE